MSEGLSERILHLFKESRFCEIRKIFMDLRWDLFPRDSELSTVQKNIILLYARSLKELGYRRKSHQLLFYTVKKNPCDLFLLEYIHSCLEYQNIVKALGTLDQFKDRKATKEDHIFKMHALYAWTYALMGAFESAESSLARASEYTTPLTNEYFTIIQSNIFQLKGNWEKSEAVVVSHLSDNPNDFDAILRLASIQVQLGNWDMAIKHYTHAIQIHPESFFPPYELGYLFLKTAHYDEAHEALLNAYHLSPDNDYSQSVSWGIGFSLFQQEQYEKALSWFRKAQSKVMIKACLSLQLGKKEELIDIHLPFPDVLSGENPYSDTFALKYLLSYWKREIKAIEKTRLALISGFRDMIEQQNLRTSSFVATSEKLVQFLRLNLPVVILISDFEGRHYAVITGYNSLTECFIIEGRGETEYSQDELFERMRSTDYWSLVAFPPEIEKEIRSICSTRENEQFRTLEKAEEDVFHLKLPLSKRRIESLPPGCGRMMRLHLLHSLRKVNRPGASLEPTINIILKASHYSEAELGFAAREYYLIKNYTQCLTIAKQAFSRNTPGSYFLCSQAALELDKIAQALRYNARGLSLLPSDVDIIIQRGVVFRRIFDFKESFRFFRIARESSPDYPLLLREIGENYRLLREYDKAEYYLKQSLELDHQDNLSWQILLAIHEEQYRFQSAEGVCQNILHQNPQEEWSFELAANFYIRQSLFPESLSIIDEGLRIHPDSLQLNLMRLEILERLGENDKAEKGYHSLLKKHPSLKLLQIQYALFLTNKECYEEAYAIFEKVSISDPDFQPAIIGMARWYALQNNLQTALDLVKRSLTTGKTDPELVTFLYRLCIPLDAVKEGAHYLISLSRDFSGYMNAGYLFEITDEFDQSLRLYRKAHTLQKNNPQPIFRIAQIHHKRGDIDEALECYKKALAIDPRFDYALEDLTLIALEKNDILKALEYAEQLLTIYPDHERGLELYLEIAETRQQFEHCHKFLESLSSRTENPAHFSIIMGKIAEAENNFEMAYHFFNQSLQYNDRYIPSYLHMAQFEMKRKNYEICKSLINKCIALQPNLPESFILRARLMEKMGKRNLAIRDCCKAIEINKSDDTTELEPYEILSHLLTPREMNRNILERNYHVVLPNQFYSLLGGAYERKGDLARAGVLYNLADPFNPDSGAFEAVIGLTYIAKQENDATGLLKIKEYLHSLLDESETHPEIYSPIEQANLREAIAFIYEGERSLSELKESLDHWRYALKITRSAWALEHASFACLDLGELTKDESYFRESIVYLRELRNPVDIQSPFSPALGDAYYFLGRYQDAVQEYDSFFNLEEKDTALQPVFFRYLDAMEKIHSPVSDITELAVQKLESLPSDRISMPYRTALQERIFRNYVKTHQHRAALRTAIRDKGFFQGLFRYFKSIFHSGTST